MPVVNNKISSTSLNWAISHILKEGDTDLLPVPFEYKILKKDWKNIEKELLEIDISNHSWDSVRRFSVPKGELSFRPICQLSPVDALLYAAIIREIGRKIEQKRASIESETVFSYRFDPKRNGGLFRKDYGWDKFWSTSLVLCGNYSHVLIADISDYYNQIYHHSIENQLDFCGISKAFRTALLNLLKTTSDDISRGIPIGPHPSNLLGELALMPLDGFLQQQQIRFCRYVDDIHIFCTSKRQAHSLLIKIAEYLDKTQKLTLNKQKTKILESHELASRCEDNLEDRPIDENEAEILSALKKSSDGPYTTLEFDDDISEELQEAFSEDRLIGILEKYTSANEIDYPRLRWFLRRLTQVGVPGAIEYIIDNFNLFTPAIADVAGYFESSARAYEGDIKKIGDKLIKLLDDDIIQSSEYLQLLIVSLFSRVREVNHIDSLLARYDKMTSSCKREILIAAANANSASWLRAYKNNYKDTDSWMKAAIIFSMRVLPDDERRHWQRAAKRKTSPLIDAIIRQTD